MKEKFYPLYQPVVHRDPTELFFIPASHNFDPHLWPQLAQQEKNYVYDTKSEPYLRTLFSVYSDAEMSK